MPWRGNIRQLRNMVERLVVMCDADTITANFVRTAMAGGPRFDAPSLRSDPVGSLRPSRMGAPAMTEAEMIRMVLRECRKP
jgi:DNA-binding NtrC family response regulator